MDNSTIKNHRQESALFSRRLIIASSFIIIFVIFLLARLAYLQVRQHTLYTTLSKQNQLTLVSIEPNRGLIYDRNGILLAQNIPGFSLDIIYDRVPNLEETIAELNKIIEISPEEQQQFYKALNQHRPFEAVSLKTKLTEEEVAKFMVNQFKFPGVTINARLIRHYPLGTVAANALGHMGRISEQDLEKINPTNYSATNYIGKAGLEKYYEGILHGTVGYQQIEIDASGRAVRTLDSIAPIPGNNIYLTIDSKLQEVAEKALGDESGAVVAIKPQTGEILVLASTPSYDPNQFIKGLSQKDFSKLQNSEARPLYNRAVSGQFAPGSTIKPFLALAGLDYKIIDKNYTIVDPGWFRLPNNEHIYHDWATNGHGVVNVTKAIIVSCDTFFYQLAVKMGISRISDTLHRFGLGEKTGIDFTDDPRGVTADPSWKLRVKGTSWYTGDTVNSGIGQGYMLTTPLQLASATATLANHGLRYRPNLLLKQQVTDNNIIKSLPMAQDRVLLNNPDNWDLVIKAMAGVINDPQGTGYRFGRNPPYAVAAKTGTAQVYKRTQSNDLLPKRLRTNSLFIAFAPIEDPQIALVVVVEHSPLAAEVARSVIDYYLSKEHHETE